MIERSLPTTSANEERSLESSAPGQVHLWLFAAAVCSIGILALEILRRLA
jgi:hypothetical protein